MRIGFDLQYDGLRSSVQHSAVSFQLLEERVCLPADRWMLIADSF
jgi:hypothetical protein